MESKNVLLKKSSVYVIIDYTVRGRHADLVDYVRALVDAGVDMVQFRAKAAEDKEALALARRLKKYTAGKLLFIINDRPDIAILSDADGVHLGQGDIPVAEARHLLGNKIIGKSCHSLAEIESAAKESVDYLALGPIFPTLIKPEREALGTGDISNAVRFTDKPVFCIGGIDIPALEKLKAAGAERAVFCRLFADCDDLKGLTTRIKESLG